MARQIVVVKALDEPGIAFKIAYWLSVPAARQSRYANATAVSQVPDATGPEISAIQTGAVTEQVQDSRWPTGTTLAQIQGFVQAEWSARQAAVTAYNPWQRTGTFFDGTTWTMTNNG